MNTLQSGAYLRPAGLLGGQAARQAIGQSQAGLIAGGWAAFTLVEIIQRKGNQVTRSWHPYSDLDKSSDRAITGLLDQISRPRPPVAGLSMSEPQVMGIVNVTPDSFSDGGEFLRSDTAIAHARQMLHDGATILDIGGESTRPGAQPVSNSQETNRVMPVIEGLTDLEAVLSVDTRKPHV
ncbi:MAG TPA: dihydropteroate synthase, partial [Rhizobiales bacterium]|nr:dihydropteroate synthase [Hyphomicrobiales bacterium]